MGSGLYSYFKTGEIKTEGSSITEGIGTTRVTANMENAPVDDAIQIDDTEAVRVIYQLLRKEGLFMGGSVGINVAGGGFGEANGAWTYDCYGTLLSGLGISCVCSIPTMVGFQRFVTRLICACAMPCT